MSLSTTLARAKTEEDVKDAWIAFLGLRDYSKGLVDIRTDKVWFESKDAPTQPLIVFAQLLVYVRAARLRGEPIPPYLAAIDRSKGAILPTVAALPALEDPAINWPASGSLAGLELAAQLAPHVGDRYTTYPVATFSPEAQTVLDEGRKLWRRFHATQFPRKIREEYKLGRPDAGWYQIRRALEAYGETELTDFDPFKDAYTALSTKLRPMVYELGFLPE